MSHDGSVGLGQEGVDVRRMAASFLVLSGLWVTETGGIYGQRDTNIMLFLRPRIGDKYTHHFLEEASAWVAFLSETEAIHIPGETDVLDQRVNAPTRIIHDARGGACLDDLKAVVLRETIEPVVYGEGRALVCFHLVTTGTCPVQGPGNIGRDVPRDSELDWLAFLVKDFEPGIIWPVIEMICGGCSVDFHGRCWWLQRATCCTYLCPFIHERWKCGTVLLSTALRSRP